MPASFFSSDSPVARRARLVKAARHAFTLWGRSSEEYQTLRAANSPDPAAILDAGRRARTRQRRFECLQNALVAVTGLTPATVYNRLAQWNGVAVELMEAVADRPEVSPAPAKKSRENEARALRAARYARP